MAIKYDLDMSFAKTLSSNCWNKCNYNW